MEVHDIYKCGVCNSILEVLHAGVEPVCCGQPMELLTENTVDAAVEKHVPVIEKTASGVKIRIGETPHPMEDSHFIEWIQILADGRSYRKFLKPGDEPEAEFEISADSVKAREYCNIHSLWSSSK